MLFLVKTASFLLISVIWAILGLYIAVPAIIFSSLVYPLGVIAEIFGGSGVKTMSEMLENSIKLYPEGFTKIHDAVYNPNRYGSGGDFGEFVGGLFVAGVVIVLATMGWGLLLSAAGWLIQLVTGS